MPVLSYGEAHALSLPVHDVWSDCRTGKGRRTVVFTLKSKTLSHDHVLRSHFFNEFIMHLEEMFKQKRLSFRFFRKNNIFQVHYHPTVKTVGFLAHDL